MTRIRSAILTVRRCPMRPNFELEYSVGKGLVVGTHSFELREQGLLLTSVFGQLWMIAGCSAVWSAFY